MRYQLALLVAAALALVACVVAGCGDQGAQPGAGGNSGDSSSGGGSSGGAGKRKPIIVASIFPLASLADEIVNSWADVVTLLPPGESEHTFELPPDKLAKLAQADVLLTVGLKMDEAVEAKARAVGRKELQLLRMSVLLKLEEPPATWGVGPPPVTPAPAGTVAAFSQPATSPHDEHDEDHADHDGHDHHHHHGSGASDPHLWLDPVLAAQYSQALADALAPRFPDMAQPLTNRARLLRANLLFMHQQYEGRLALVPNRRLVTFHNAFDRLAARYNLQVVAHLTDIEITPGGDVTPRRMKDVVDAVRTHNLRVLYAEPQLPESAVKALAQETGVRVMRLDPLGNPAVPGYETYLKMMASNLDTLAEGQTLRK